MHHDRPDTGTHPCSPSGQCRATEGPIPSARLTQGLVIAMQQYSRKHVIDLLNHLGVHPVAGEASRALPDPADADQVAKMVDAARPFPAMT